MYSDRQLDLIEEALCGDAFVVLAVGAIRSGKTWIELEAFKRWGHSRPEPAAPLALCAQTVTSIDRNLVDTYRKMQCLVDRNHSQSNVTVDGLVMHIHGVSDKRAAPKIMGGTLGGALVDELTLIDEDFFDKLTTRCSVAGAKIFATCNPDVPSHWVRRKILNDMGRWPAVVLDFTLDDNPDLSDEVKDRYRRQYSGVFAKRYLEGLWVAGVGLVFPDYTDDIPHPRREPDERAYSLDYGSAGTYVVLKEECYNEQWWVVDQLVHNFEDEEHMDDDELVAELATYVRDPLAEIVYCDPSTPRNFKVLARKAGLYLQYIESDVLDGLRITDNALSNQRLLLEPSPAIPLVHDEIGAYAWDPDSLKQGREAPKKEYDHCMDSMRYFAVNRLKAHAWV